MAIAGFCSAWQNRYGDKYPFAHGKDGMAVKAMLAHVGQDVPKFLAVVARYLADTDPFYAADGRHGLAKLRQNFARWLVAALPPASKPPIESAMEVTMRIRATINAENAAKGRPLI